MSDEYTKKRERLYAVLSERVGLTKAEEYVGSAKLRILLRMSGEVMRVWLGVIHNILSAEGSASWAVDISKKYFLMNGRVVQGWRVVLESKDMPATVDAIRSIVEEATAPRVELDSFPLPGAHPDRNTPNSLRKGAVPVGGGGV